MPFLIFFLILSLPVLEVASIVEVSRWVGPVLTVVLLAASVTFGAFLIRSQSMMMGRRVMQAVQERAAPEQALLDSGSIMFAGVLFMIPGFFSDLIALIVLLPAARRFIWRGVSFSMRERVRQRESRPRDETLKPRGQAGDVIDVEFTEVPPGQEHSGTSARPESPWSKP